MPTTQTGPALENSVNDFVSGFSQLLLDAGRAKWVDVERVSDDNNIPDYADLKTGQAKSSSQDATGGNFAQVFGNMTPLQMAGGLLAVGLTVGLLSGSFSPRGR